MIAALAMIADLAIVVALAAGPAPAIQPCPVGEDRVVPASVGYQLQLVPPEPAPRTSWRWTTGDYVREALVLGLIGIDWHQTLTFRSQGVEELNPILGRIPSRARVNTLIAAGALAHLGIAIALPHGTWRTTWQASVGGAEFTAVVNNARHGY